MRRPARQSDTIPGMKWITDHSCIKLETRFTAVCVSIGINFESDLAWFNLLFWNFCLMWNVQPGRPHPLKIQRPTIIRF